MILDLVILILIVFIFFFCLKLNLFLLYIWQNYEYRFDRIKAYFKSKRFYYDFLDLINPLEFLLIRRPKITMKIGLLLLLNIYFQSTVFLKTLKPLSIIFKINSYFFLSILIALFVLLIFILFINAFLTFLLNLPSVLLKKYYIWKAREKIKKLPDLISIGITGSYGKSSTKEILAHLLAKKYQVVKTKGSINTAIGVARTVLNNLDSKTDVFIVEMGAYKEGEIAKICQIVKAKIGIITGINQQHLELFGSQEKILKTKYELIESLPKNGLAVFNIQDQLIRDLCSKTKLRKLFYKKAKKSYQSNLEADFLQININGAVKVASYLKVDRKKINKALKKIPLSKHFLQKKKGFNKSLVWDNSYNTNPSSFLASLKLLKKSQKSKNVVITPGIIELGPEGHEIHKKIAKQISKLSNTLILTNKNFYHIFKKHLSRDVKLLVARPKMDWNEIVKKGNIVLLEGRIPLWLYKKIVNVKDV